MMVQFDARRQNIDNLKFINFGSTVKMENAANIIMPEQIDHFPPELLSHYIDMKRFCVDGNNADLTRLKDKEFNIQFIQSCASFDVFSLGVCILQIVTGQPTQLQLPVRFKCNMINESTFINTPAFGCSHSIADEKQVNSVIKLQNKVLNNLEMYLEKNDRYGLCHKDKDLYNLLVKMLSKDYYRRPDVKEIL